MRLLNSVYFEKNRMAKVRLPSAQCFTTVHQIKSILIFFVVIIISCNQIEDKSLSPPVIATFEQLDTLATNDWWNRDPNEIFWDQKHLLFLIEAKILWLLQ